MSMRGYRYIFDPDPDPNPFPWTLILLVMGAMIIFNPGLINNIVFWLNPKLAEQEKEKQEAMINAIIYICIVSLVGIALLVIWQFQKKKRRRGYIIE